MGSDFPYLSSGGASALLKGKCFLGIRGSNFNPKILYKIEMFSNDRRIWRRNSRVRGPGPTGNGSESRSHKTQCHWISISTTLCCLLKRFSMSHGKEENFNQKTNALKTTTDRLHPMQTQSLVSQQCVIFVDMSVFTLFWNNAIKSRFSVLSRTVETKSTRSLLDGISLQSWFFFRENRMSAQWSSHSHTSDCCPHGLFTEKTRQLFSGKIQNDFLGWMNGLSGFKNDNVRRFWILKAKNDSQRFRKAQVFRKPFPPTESQQMKLTSSVLEFSSRVARHFTAKCRVSSAERLQTKCTEFKPSVASPGDGLPSELLDRGPWQMAKWSHGQGRVRNVQTTWASRT